MAVTISLADLAYAIGADHGVTADPDTAEIARVTRLLTVASQVVTDYAPDAPQAVANEAVVRFCGYLYSADFGAIRSDELGAGLRLSYATNHAAAFRFSGAAGLLTRYKRRHAGRI